MKILTKVCSVLTTGILALAGMTTANAAGYGGVDFEFAPYIGAKVGAIIPSNDSLDADIAPVLGVVAGYQIDSDFGTEFEYVSTVVDSDYGSGEASGEYGVNTMGAYATYRYRFPTENIYVKAKLGYAQTSMDFGSTTPDGKGMAGAVGLGMHLDPKLSVEAEYSNLPDVGNVDVSAITVGARLNF